MRQKVVVLTGAGISAESGLKTFRDKGGLWEGHNIVDVASSAGWNKNPSLVLDFYNKRRRQLLKVEPNQAHKSLLDLEQGYETIIITQNVDDLHERGGSTNIIHLHGELLKSRSTIDPNLIYNQRKDINKGDFCKLGSQLRPDIVWFGENVPLIQLAIEEISTAHFLVIIGTSLEVYPAANLINYAPKNCECFYIDPKYNQNINQNIMIIKELATVGTPIIVKKLLGLL